MPNNLCFLVKRMASCYTEKGKLLIRLWENKEDHHGIAFIKK